MIKKMLGTTSLLFLISMFILNAAFADAQKLSKKNYVNFENEKGVVLYGVNWGRQWGCAGLDNAQLQNITFSPVDSLVSDSSDDISLNISSKLLSENISKPYAILVDPGEYSLKSFDVRIVKSDRKVQVMRWIDEKMASGGTFRANAGEIVYIGEFGLDCVKEPVLWRYYIEEEDFGKYVKQFKSEYKFIKDKEVVYRLFQSKIFAQNE